MNARILKLSDFRVKSSVSENFYPKLSLQGKWLADLGFLTGDRVLVTINQDQIIISRLGKDKISGEAEAGNAEEQPTRNSR